jgi:hypothetical protein
MYSKIVAESIKKGLDGGNEGLAITLGGELSEVSRLSRLFTFGPKKYVTLGAPGGVGKTSFTLYRFIYIPIIQYLTGNSKFNPYLIYHLTERPLEYVLGKILSMHIYHQEGKIYDVATIYSMSHKQKDLGEEDRAVLRKHLPFLDKLEEHLFFHTGTATLEKTDLIQKDHLKRTSGKDLVVGHFTDHVNNIVQEGTSEREVLATHSDRMKYYRDIESWFCFDISQFNRDTENDYRVLKRGVRVKKSDWFGSSKFQMNCDLMLGLIDPKYYDVNKYKCEEGAKEHFDMDECTNASGYNRFRALWVAKNSDGKDSTYIPIAFAGENGVSSELPPAGEMTSRLYDIIKTGNFYSL